MEVEFPIIKKTGKIIILALSWRDIRAPKAGGAEVHTHEMLSRLNKKKYEVYHFSVKNKHQVSYEVIDGVHYLRHGNLISVIFAARKFYRKYKENIDFVIDQCNTHRFFTPFWVEPQKRIFYIHQLTKEIWDISVPFPISKIGKILEELLLGLNKNDYVITVSDSTRDDLLQRGYKKEKIKIIHNGVSFKPWNFNEMCVKENNPTFIYVGRYSPYKGIDIAIKAFARLKELCPNVKLWILGKKDSNYVDKYIMPICMEYHLKWADITENNKDGDILSWGYVSEDKKLELLSRAWCLLFPSIREGWGIPITEAGCVGTPSIAFNSPGIREAVNYDKAGYLCNENSVEGLLEQMQKVITDKEDYLLRRDFAYSFSSQFQWEMVGTELESFLVRIKKENEQ